MTTAYYEDLAALLLAHGLPAGEVADTVERLAAHAAGADPEDEYGPCARLAERLTGAASGPVDGAPGPETDPTARTRTWTADAFGDRARLDAFGAAGWEVERVDERDRFVARRDLADPARRWEYRRETGDAPAPDGDGWEPCGTWLCFRYYKRPAQGGPGDLLDPIPRTSSRRAQLSLMVACYVATLAAVGIGWTIFGGASSGSGTGLGFLGGFLIGGAVAAGVLVIARARRP
ncbi:hypothetical protein ACQP1W_48585 [Spirillospora sp. CA-255316]